MSRPWREFANSNSPRPAHRCLSRAESAALIERLESRRLLTIAGPVAYNIGSSADQFVPNAAPITVASADLNGDRKLDLIVTHTSNNTINFLKGNGDGTFQPAVAISVGQAIQGDVFVADFNRDGKPDLFLPSANNQPIIMLGNGNGTFGQPIASSSFAFSGYYPRGWAVGDFNRDGKPDVVCTLPSNSANAGRYMVLLGTGDGTFQSGLVGPAVLGYSRWVTTGTSTATANSTSPSPTDKAPAALSAMSSSPSFWATVTGPSRSAATTQARNSPTAPTPPQPPTPKTSLSPT